MDKEMAEFQADLLESVRQMKAGKAARTHKVNVQEVTEARAKMGMTQTEFADLLDVSPRTLQGWEQGRRTPSRLARTLIRIARSKPDVLREALKTA